MTERDYSDIIDADRPRPVRARMPRANRAAQFMPFAALKGYDDTLAETVRQTEERVALDEAEARALNESLARLEKLIRQKPAVSVTYFERDARKKGGRYVNISGRAERLSVNERTLTLEDGKRIAFDDMIELTARL